MNDVNRAELEAKPALTICEFAAYCGRSTRWAYDVVYRGEVRTLKHSRLALIPQSEVRRFFSEVSEYTGRRASTLSEKA